MKKLSEYNVWLEPIFLSIVDQSEFSSTPDILEILKNKKLVVVLNHSTPLSWLPAVSYLTSLFVKNGGADRIPKGVVDKWFFSNPFTKGIAEYLTQKTEPDDKASLVNGFINNEFTDLAILPEGANTFFGDPNEIQSFRSNKFIEIALESKTPILVVVHKGSEGWSVPIEIPKHIVESFSSISKFFAPKLMQGQAMNFPLPIEKIKTFKMKCVLFTKHLEQPDQVIEDISSEIKNLMIELKSQL